MVKTPVVQDDGRKSKCNVTNSPPSSVDPVKPAKPVHVEGDVKVCKPKRQTKSHYSSSQSLNSDYREKQCAKVHTIKLSGLKFNIAERTLEELAKPFGHLANRVKIVHFDYPGICYAYVDYRHKSSAEEAVLQLDKSELDGTKIHVCHKGADHNCGRELKILNNPNKLTSDMNVLSATSSKSGTLTLDSKAAEQHEMELDKTAHQAHEVINLSPDASACTVDCVKGDPVSELTSSESSHRQSSKVYSVKLSGFRINVEGSEIDWLVRPFGELTDPIGISQYPETNISYALVNYKQKDSAEKAVLKLDGQELNNHIIHVCHQGELAVDHDCCSVLDALNAAVVDNDLLDVLKTKSLKFINHLALTRELDFKSALRSVTVSSCDHDVTHELNVNCGAQNCTTLEVTNLHPDTWFQDLNDHFKSCDSPISICLNYYAYSSSAFICYASTDVASKVMKQYDGSELNGYQIHVVKANYDIPKTKSPVSDLTVIRTGKEVTTKPIQDAHTLVMKDTKKQSGVSSKKKTASLKQ